MKTDTYTKVVLTIIAFMLTLIACKGVISPENRVSAEGPFSGLQFTGEASHFDFFDTRTGEIWDYQLGIAWHFKKLKVAKPGERPVVLEKKDLPL